MATTVCHESLFHRESTRKKGRWVTCLGQECRKMKQSAASTASYFAVNRPSRIDISRRSTPMVPGRFLPAANIARLAENTAAVSARLLILQTDARGSCNLACVCPVAVKHARVRFPLLRSRVALAPRKTPAEIRDFLGLFNEITFEGRTAAAYARDN